MSSGPLVPRSNDTRSNDPRNDVPRNDGSRELQPAEPAEFIRPPGSALYDVLPSQESTLREYLRTLIKRKWMVTAVVVGIFMAVAIASLRQTPVYEAVGRIVADLLQTDSNRTSALLGGFRGNLHVTIIPNTRIIEIHYTSTDPQLAASAVNTLAATYVEQNFKTKFESTMQASDWLSKQLVDLQMKVETSQEKLVRYQKEHEILGTDEKQNIITEKLAELNKEMTMAEADRMQKEVAYRQTQSDDPVAVSAAVVSDTSGGGTGAASA